LVVETTWVRDLDALPVIGRLDAQSTVIFHGHTVDRDDRVADVRDAVFPVELSVVVLVVEHLEGDDANLASRAGVFPPARETPDN
jgi:hypothetical protein